MDSSNAVFYWLGFEVAILLLFWPWVVVRAMSKIQTGALFKANRPLHRIEFWRFQFCYMLLWMTSALIIVIISRYDIHKPIYKYPVAIVRLLAASLICSTLIALCSWLLFKITLKRDAKFHHPNLSTWKGIGFWGPKKRKMTPEERVEFLRKMDWIDYMEAVRNTAIGFALLPLLILLMDLLINGPMEGFAPEFKSFFSNLLPVEIFLVGLACPLGTIIWLWQRFLLWIGWKRTYC